MATGGRLRVDRSNPVTRVLVGFLESQRLVRYAVPIMAKVQSATPIYGACIAACTLSLSIPALAAPPPAPSGEGAVAVPSEGAASQRRAAPPSQRRPPRPPPRQPTSRGSQPSAAPEPAVETPSTDLSGAWSYSSEDAPEPAFVKSARETELSINPIGFYQGVTVTGENLPPHVAKELGVMPAVLTWSGFERTESGSRVFFQLSAGVEYELTAQGMLVSVRLPNTSSSVRNNIRRLDTSYFRTPVTSVMMQRRGPDMVISLTLRREASPNVAMVDGEHGYKVLVLEFPDTDADLTPPDVQ